MRSTLVLLAAFATLALSSRPAAASVAELVDCDFECRGIIGLVEANSQDFASFDSASIDFSPYLDRPGIDPFAFVFANAAHPTTPQALFVDASSSQQRFRRSSFPDDLDGARLLDSRLWMFEWDWHPNFGRAGWERLEVDRARLRQRFRQRRVANARGRLRDRGPAPGIPEPAAFWLFGSGAIIAGAALKRRRA